MPIFETVDINTIKMFSTKTRDKLIEEMKNSSFMDFDEDTKDYFSSLIMRLNNMTDKDFENAKELFHSSDK